MARPGGGVLVAGELGDGFLGAGIVDEVLAGGRGGDERGGGGVVEGAGQAGGDAVQAGDGVVGEQGLVAAGQGQVVAQVGGRFGQVHGLDGVPGGDPLVQGGEVAQPQPPGEGGLADQDPGEQAGAVHVRVGHEPQFLEPV